jgi:hypothetical protein
MLKELTGENKQKRFRRLLGRQYMESEGIISQIKQALNGMNATSSLTFVVS